jgi:hypothetical protein
VVELYGKNRDKTDHLIALIPLAIIERFEWAQPCEILKEYKRKKYPHY